MRRVLGKTAALIGMFVWTAGFGATLGSGNFTEEYSLLFSFLALAAYFTAPRRPIGVLRHLLIGICLGCAFWLRANNVGAITALYVLEFILVLSRRMDGRAAVRQWLAAMAGFALPFIAIALYIIPRGAWDAFLQASFRYNAAYSAAPNIVATLAKALEVYGFVLGVLGVGLLAAMDRIAGSGEESGNTAWLLACWLWIDLIIEISLSSLSGRGYGHYLITWLPAIAVASALTATAVATKWPEYLASIYAPVVMLMAALTVWANYPSLQLLAQGAYNRVVVRKDFQYSEIVPRWLNAHSENKDTVFVWGGSAGINYLAQRDAPTSQILYGHLVPSAYTQQFAEQFLAQVQAQPPRYIVDNSQRRGLPPLSESDPVQWFTSRQMYPQPLVQQFFDWAHKHYVVAVRLYGVPIYEWRQ